jgi:hypothetical protein
MQNDPVVSKASELLRLGLMPSAEELRAGKVSWSYFPCVVYCLWNILGVEFVGSGYFERE